MDEGTSSHHGYSHRPYGMAVDIQRPRALIDAYGADERNTTTNQNQNMRHVKNSTINGLSSKVGEQTWQTTEEEEFEWEDMSPTLAGHGHAFGANRSMPKKNDFSRTNWSNQEMLPSVVLNNAVSSDSSIFENLCVMVVEDMIYLIHLKGIAGLINSAINKEYELRYVDLQHNPPQMVTEIERSFIGAQFLSLQKLFSAVFCGNVDSTSNVRVPDANNQPSSDVIDLSHLMQDTLVTLPTLNGWLLSYPVVYIFGKDHIEDAVYNLSTKSLHLFSIFVRRNSSSSKRPPEEELMSFSVPYDLSIDGENEAWAEAFLARMKARWEGCKHVWGSMRMEVSATYPQAIAL